METTNTNQKIYISGPMEDPNACRSFVTARTKLIAEGFEPVNSFINVSRPGYDQDEQIIDDLRILMSCGHVYMLAGWATSKDARIKLKFAEEMGKKIVFESFQDRQRSIGAENDRFAGILKAAIMESNGADFDQREVKDRSNDVFYSRMIFTIHCRQYGMTLQQIKTYTHRDHTTMLHYLKRYKDEYKFNSEFRKMADRVSDVMAKYKRSIEAEKEEQ